MVKKWYGKKLKVMFHNNINQNHITKSTTIKIEVTVKTEKDNKVKVDKDNITNIDKITTKNLLKKTTKVSNKNKNKSKNKLDPDSINIISIKSHTLT